MPKINKLFFYPPLAFARMGQSPHPMESFSWGPNDESPRGLGETTLTPQPTLHLDDDGNVTVTKPDSEAEIKFKDKIGKKEVFRPVCPFFELHAEIEHDGEVREAPVTPALLDQFGLSLEDVDWQVQVANRKAYHYTFNEADKVQATVSIKGNHTQAIELKGLSPEGYDDRLADDVPIILGKAQLTKPNEELPGLRIRITASKGLIYAPTNFKEHVQKLIDKGQTDLKGYLGIEDDQCILNPKADWNGWNPTAYHGDPRTNPGSLYAQSDNGVSLGVMDDSSDGLISCKIKGVDSVAYGRFTVGPQDFQPDRRHVVGVSDMLKDLVDRKNVEEPAYMDAKHWGLTEAEVQDLMEKVFETMSSSNLDVQNWRSNLANTRMGLSQEEADSLLFPQRISVPGNDLPLTATGREYHRRFMVYEVFQDMMREQPSKFEDWVRDPNTDYMYYDKKMPALMRGSDAYPLHLTRRQYNFLKHWISKIRS